MYRKIIYLVALLFIILLSGCSGLRKNRTVVTDTGSETPNYSAIINTVSGYNIAERGFEIKKGAIELEGTEIEGRFGINARLNNRGDFYASVRGPLGIELVRILMVGNEVAAIDRINKTVYLGNREEVLRKNGMPEDFLKILVGDMPAENDGNYRISAGGQVTVTAGDGAFRRDISVCLDEMKVCGQKIESLNSGHTIFMSFGNFIMTEGIKYPSLIGMEEKSRMFHVKLEINDLVYGYDSAIEFKIPAYKREAL